MPFEIARVESYWLLAICKLLEHRLTKKLRFEGGAIYSVGVSPFFGHEAPSRRDAPIRGDVAVQFSCAPGAQAALAHTVVAEVAALQTDGPSAEEVATALALEQRGHEVEVETNQWWLEVRTCMPTMHARYCLLRVHVCSTWTQSLSVLCAVQTMLAAYQSRQLEMYGGPDAVFKADQAARREMRAAAAPDTFRAALRRLLPWPCEERHTVVTTVEGTTWHLAAAALRTAAPWLLGALMLGALWMWRGRAQRAR